jgi:3-hydroxyacyl-CoA dehydrogenase/enoyl-CoA hydratase/3-hydroxybutyryl-CoA epimerase
MADEFRHLRLERDARGVACVTIDVRGAPMNVFNEEVFADLQGAIERLEKDPPRLTVLRSGKPSGFLAGADVKQIQGLTTPDEVRAALAAGQQLFDRVERLPCPTVAVIHGACLGGGLEFALACRYRIARDDAQTKIGLPEVMLGLIPGWGGTQRLPRAVGLRQALRMILEGSMLSASKAAAAGLVDLAIPPSAFEAEVQRFIEDRLAGRSVRRPSRGLLGVLLEGTAPGRAVILAVTRKKIRRRGEHYPALPAALRAVQAGLRGGMAAGLAAERDEFPALLFSPVARNLIDLFFQREKARNLSTWVGGQEPRPVRKSAVVGAGVMGAGIAQLLAFSKIPIVLKDLNAEIVAAGMKKIEGLTDDAAKKGLLSREEAEAVVRNVTPADTWEPLADADLVIEAVVEREDVKCEVFRQLAERLPAPAVFASNTSALSVSRLAEAVPHPQRVAGLHFFNPVHRMQLVEVVRGKSTDDATVATLVELVRKLGKVPVVVADSPGFLVNRILFPYLDEAVRLVVEGVPGETVDGEAVRFGMPMGPLELLDQVGIDVAADVAGSLAKMHGDPGPTPERLAAMTREGWTGKKAGRGFYVYNKDRRRGPTRWAISDTTRPQGHVRERLIHPMINEAARCLESGVVPEAWAVDLAMVLGTGFAPFRGGPLRTADALGLDRVVREMNELRRTAGDRFEPCGLLRLLAAEGRGFHTERPPSRILERQEVHQ